MIGCCGVANWNFSSCSVKWTIKKSPNEKNAVILGRFQRITKAADAGDAGDVGDAGDAAIEMTVTDNGPPNLNIVKIDTQDCEFYVMEVVAIEIETTSSSDKNS